MANNNEERELKLTPSDPALLDRLADVDRLGELRVSGRRHEQQRNSFYDTASGGLGRAHVGFRRRVIEGERLARWSLKGDSELAAQRGVATRAEIEVQLDPETAPALALGALRQAARTRGAAALAEQVSAALASGELPLKQPFLETETDRRILDLVDESGQTHVELALDRVQLVGHKYNEVEIEAELKRGHERVLDEVRSALERFGEVRESEGSKLSRALHHVQQCQC
ncbi:MAG TPA: CYTH domain-containing protein [Chloroflexota bacterium]|jgi:inorganic triphosphatase YgiF|nr:CYTH domain-containing protein [Chloroflexota bacterium]